VDKLSVAYSLVCRLSIGGCASMFVQLECDGFEAPLRDFSSKFKEDLQHRVDFVD
jgi:hypothetical protein